MHNFTPDKHIHWDVRDNKTCPVCSAKRQEISSKLAESENVFFETHKLGCMANIMSYPTGERGKCTCVKPDQPENVASEELCACNLVPPRGVHVCSKDQPQLEEWEKEFDSAFDWIDKEKERCEIMYGFTADKLKDLIRTERNKEYERGRKELTFLGTFRGKDMLGNEVAKEGMEWLEKHIQELRDI